MTQSAVEMVLSTSLRKYLQIPLMIAQWSKITEYCIHPEVTEDITTQKQKTVNASIWTK